MVEWLTLLLHNWEVLGSNLDPKTGYPDWGFSWFPHILHSNIMIALRN
jgi:hypothetical protein